LMGEILRTSAHYDEKPPKWDSGLAKCQSGASSMS
jgi:hypothetical protein